VLCALFLPFWLFCMASIGYAFFFTPYELLVLAMGIDAFFGDTAHGSWFMYTLAISIIFLSTYYIKPYFIFSTRHE
jgi:hypothetical protein